jgi:YVTN family beta-propeller protein
MIDLRSTITEQSPRDAPAGGRPVSGSPIFVSIFLAPEGRVPALPAFTPDHRTLVVPNEGSDNVSIISLEQLSVEATINLRRGSRPWQAKVAPAGGLVYITNSQFDGTSERSSRAPSTVAVIDISRREIVDEIHVGAGPNGITIDQRGRRGYVANMRSNTVSVIDIGRHNVIATIPTGAAPAFVKLTRDLDGRLLLVTNLRDSSVTVIDTDALEVVNTVEIGVPGLCDTYPEWGPGDTTGVAISDDDIAYLTNYRSHTLAVLDLNDWSLERFPSPIRFPFFVEIDRDEGLVLFSSGIEKKFALLDTRTREWCGIHPSDGTAFPSGRASTLNIWMTDPAHDRITGILPRGLTGIADWDRNIVTKFM